MKTIHRIELDSQHGKVNVYLLLGSEITLIDAGENRADCYEELREALELLNLSISHIQKIILTHMHADHSGLIHKIMERSKAVLYVNAKAKHSFVETYEEAQDEYNSQLKYMTNCYSRWGAGKPKKLWGRIYPFPIKRERIFFLRDNDYVFAGDSYYKVIETPGHTQLDISLYNKENKTLFSGDLILPGISPVAYIEAPFPGELERPYSLIQYIESLKKVPAKDDLLIYPGHGKEFVGSKEWIRHRILKVDSKCEKILRLIKEQKNISVHTICKTLHAKSYENIPYTVLSNIVSHLEFMEKRQLVKRTKHSFVDYYDVYKT